MKRSPDVRGHILITGTSTGIGRACALRLARAGFDVLAGVRSGEDGVAIEQAWRETAASRASVRPLRMDVTDAQSIASAAEQVRSIVGDAGLRGLVNNAGVCVFGPVECISIDDWRRQFEVNVFGQIAVTQAMLPLLRAHVRGHGRRTARIVMISSIAGRLSQPVAGAYCASKYALEAVSDALRNELKPEGVSVSLIEPGVFSSEIWRKAVEQGERLLADPALPARERYARQIAAVASLARDISTDARPAERVADVVYDCLTRRHPVIRRLVGPDAKFVAALKGWLPDRWFDSLLRWTIDRKSQKLENEPRTQVQARGESPVSVRP